MTDATYRSVNRAGWDQLTLHDSHSSRAYGPEQFARARELLDPAGWFPWRRLRAVLCLAGGGGQRAVVGEADQPVIGRHLLERRLLHRLQRPPQHREAGVAAVLIHDPAQRPRAAVLGHGKCLLRPRRHALPAVPVRRGHPPAGQDAEVRGQVPVKVLLGAGAGAGLSPAFAADMGRRPGFPATIRRIEALAAARPARRGLAAAVQG